MRVKILISLAVLGIILGLFLGLRGHMRRDSVSQNNSTVPSYTPQQVIDLVNKYRNQNNVVAMRQSAILTKAAAAICQDENQYDYFGDTNPITGETSQQLVAQFLPSDTYYSNNMTEAASPQEAVNNWEDSAPHNRNLLDNNFDSTGVSICTPTNGDLFTYYIQVYASLLDHTPVSTTIITPSPSGTLCADGWVSPSTGSGTCSHHDGEAY